MWAACPARSNFIEAVSDPRQESTKPCSNRAAGAYDPYALDLDAVNADLAQIKL